MSPSELRLFQRRILAEKCRRDFELFTRHFVWPVVEGTSRPMKSNWHISAICKHLEALSRNEFRNLLINLPPRFMKSLLISVAFPVWCWINDPSRQFITASYSRELSIRDAVKSRRIIDSPSFQEAYGDIFQLISDENQKSKYVNDHNGHRFSTSVTGQLTGEGGDYVLADDPHNALAAESEDEREKVLTWWAESASTRLNDPSNAHKLVVMQRLHARDLSGYILENGGYEHICIPMRYEESRGCVTVLGRQDPRNVEGELAWPERLPEEEVALLEKTMGAYAVSGQLQQTPSSRSGALFEVEKLQVVAAAPAAMRLVRGYDLAATEEKTGGKPAYTVGVLLGVDNLGRFFVCDVMRGRFGPLEVEQAITRTAAKDGKRVRISLPQDPGAAGKVQAATYISKLRGYVAKASPETGSKMQRAEPFAAQVAAGNVYLVAGAWNTEYKDELRQFPSGAFKDQADASSRAFAELIEMPSGADNIISYYKTLAENTKAAAASVDQERGGNIIEFARSFGNG